MECGETKACNACRTAKRRCNRRLPVCQRCELRGLECVYPPQTSFVVYGATDQQWKPSNIPCNDGSMLLELSTPRSLDIARIHKDQPTLEQGLVCPSLADLQTAWFLTTDT